MLVDASIAVAVVGLLVAWVWRWRDRAAIRRRVVLMLGDPDAAVRRQAAVLVGDLGLARYGSAVLARTRLETDGPVLDALSDAVARNQWEPLADADLMDLRMWAAQLAEPSPAETPPPVAADDAVGSDTAVVEPEVRALIDHLEAVLGTRVVALRASWIGELR